VGRNDVGDSIALGCLPSSVCRREGVGVTRVEKKPFLEEKNNPGFLVVFLLPLPAMVNTDYHLVRKMRQTHSIQISNDKAMNALKSNKDLQTNSNKLHHVPLECKLVEDRTLRWW